MTGIHTFGSQIFLRAVYLRESHEEKCFRCPEGERAVEIGGEVHSDVWGKSPVESKSGKLYWVTFIDDKTRFTHLYFLKTKDQTFGVYKEYEA
jgi:hypothetical protein